MTDTPITRLGATDDRPLHETTHERPAQLDDSAQFTIRMQHELVERHPELHSFQTMAADAPLDPVLAAEILATSEKLRLDYFNMAFLVVDTVAPGAERDKALHHLQESKMWAIEALYRGGLQ